MLKRKSEYEIHQIESGKEFINTSILLIESIKFFSNQFTSQQFTVSLSSHLSNIQLIIHSSSISFSSKEIIHQIQSTLFIKKLQTICQLSLSFTNNETQQTHQLLSSRNSFEWNEEILFHYEIPSNYLVIEISHLFENSPERRQPINEIVQSISAFHCIHFELEIQMKYNEQIVLYCQPCYSIEQSYFNSFHYQMKLFHSLYSFNEIQLLGLRIPINNLSIIKQTEFHFCLLINDYLIHHKQLQEIINSLHCSYFSVYQTSILQPPFFLQLQMKDFQLDYQMNYQVQFDQEKEVLKWIEQILYHEFFPENPLYKLLPPSLEQYPFCHYLNETKERKQKQLQRKKEIKDVKSLPPYPTKKRIFAISYSMKGIDINKIYNEEKEYYSHCNQMTENKKYIQRKQKAFSTKTIQRSKSIISSRTQYSMKTKQSINTIKTNNSIKSVNSTSKFGMKYEKHVVQNQNTNEMNQNENEIYSIVLPFCKDKIYISKNQQLYNHVIPSNTITKSDISSLQVIGQFDNKFICCLHPRNNILYLFDQHAIHERILYESNWKLFHSHRSQIMKQNEMCIEVEVNQSQLTILSKYQDQFKSLSINYKFLQRRIKLLSLPILFDKHITISQFIQMINQIDHDHYFFGFDQIKIIRNIIASHSCRNAIMFNDKLSFTECSHLIHQFDHVLIEH